MDLGLLEASHATILFQFPFPWILNQMGLRIEAGQKAYSTYHSRGNICPPGVNYEVPIIAHQAIDVAEPMAASTDIPQQILQGEGISLILVDRFLRMAAGTTAIERAFALYPQRPGHGIWLS
jgi:hypothetical protein